MLRMQLRNLPQASGAAPTVIVTSVAAIMKRPSATTKSAKRAKRVLQAHAMTKAGAKREAKANTWANTITTNF